VLTIPLRLLLFERHRLLPLHLHELVVCKEIGGAAVTKSMHRHLSNRKMRSRLRNRSLLLSTDEVGVFNHGNIGRSLAIRADDAPAQPLVSWTDRLGLLHVLIWIGYLDGDCNDGDTYDYDGL